MSDYLFNAVTRKWERLPEYLAPQLRTLVNHLKKKGSITNVEAQAMYKMRALPRRIADLKDEGYTIDRKMSVDMTGQRYARYFLVAA